MLSVATSWSVCVFMSRLVRLLRSDIVWPRQLCLLFWCAFIITASGGCLLLSAWDLCMNGLSVLASGGGGPWEHQRTPSLVLAPRRNGTTWSLYCAECSWLSVPHKHPPKESVELPGPEGRLWNRRQFYGDAWAPQPSQFSLVTSSALSSHRWSSWNPRMICELRQFTQQMPATNREITSASSPNSVLLSPPENTASCS